MINLNLLKESFFNGYAIEILDLIYLISIFSGIFVIISKNPIISVLFLISLFFSVSGYLITLGLNFMGLSYLLVYVGAVSILFIFILMLINVRISELLNDTSNSIPLAIIIGIFFMYPIYEILPYYQFLISFNLNDFFLNNDILFVTSKTWDGGLAENPHITSIGNIMYTNYFMWLIVTSLILLLAMIGAISLVIS